MRVVRLLLATTMFVGCGGSTSAAKSKEYDVRGKVVSVDSAGKYVTIDHEDVPGLMKAMEMKFDVENETMVASVKNGDRVEGKLAVESGKYVIRSLKTVEPGGGR